MGSPRARELLRPVDASAAREAFSSPPPAPKIAPLSLALLRGNYEAVARVLDDDPVAALVPIDGCEPPLVYAVQNGCSELIMELLLERGAAIDDVGTARLTALEINSGKGKALDPLDSLPRFALPVDGVWHSSPSMPTFDGAFALWSHFPDQLLAGGCSPMPFEASLISAPPEPQLNDHRQKVGMLLLSHGAKPLQAAEIARRAGYSLLAALITHWSGMKARKLLEAHWRRWDQAPFESDCNLMRVPTDLRQRLCNFLAPAKWELLGAQT